MSAKNHIDEFVNEYNAHPFHDNVVDWPIRVASTGLAVLMGQDNENFTRELLVEMFKNLLLSCPKPYLQAADRLVSDSLNAWISQQN